MQNIIIAYHGFIWLFPINTKTTTTLADLEYYIFQSDIRQTLVFSKLHTNDDSVKEAYLCLQALIEQFDRLVIKNKTLWIFNSYRIGDLSSLARDINCWNKKLLTRLILLK